MTTPSRAKRIALDLQSARIDLEKEFGEQGFRNGISYVTDKRIHIQSAHMDEERVWHLVAAVRGTDSEPYTTTVEMEFFEFGIDIFAAECTCPVRLNCKHAAALSYLWTTLQPQKSGTLTGAAAEPIGEGMRQPEPVLAPVAGASTTLRTGLAPDLSKWLRASFDPVQRRDSPAEPDAKPANEFVAFLLTAVGEITIA